MSVPSSNQQGADDALVAVGWWSPSRGMHQHRWDDPDFDGIPTAVAVAKKQHVSCELIYRKAGS